MRVGVVKEIKPQERRVALTPARAGELVASGHEVLVERDVSPPRTEPPADRGARRVRLRGDRVRDDRDARR
jgi:alanine dehydrogenase